MPLNNTVLYEKKGKIAYVTLNRPEILNAVNDTLADELSEAWAEFDADPEVHVAILSGKGRAFSSGADVKQRQLRPREELIRLGGPAGKRSDALNQAVNWKPVIGAVHGYAYGAGWGLATACDLLVAAEETKFQITEVRRGLGGCTHWVRAWFWMGNRFANEVAITGRVYTAEEAYQYGWLNRVVPQDRLMATAEELAAEILKNPPLSVRATVRMARYFVNEMTQPATLYQKGLNLHLTEDFHEGALAFVEKRQPEFHGR